MTDNTEVNRHNVYKERSVLVLHETTMGRIKTKLIKAKTKEIMAANSERLSKDFSENKKSLADLAVIRSKKMRNAIAGYLVRLKKAQ